MTPFIEAYLERMDVLHIDIINALSDLPPAANGWKPEANMNSIAVLVVHLTGAERYWIGDVALQEPSGRERAAEFRVAALESAELRLRLDASLAYAERGLARLADADLSLERSTPSHAGTFTVSWALLHALEHTATHVGHIQLTREWWFAVH